MKALLCLLILTILNTAALADGPIRHVVHVKFKKEATPEQIDKVVKEFAALPSKIALINNFEWGTDIGTDGRAKGFSHIWIMTFKSVADRDSYLNHPAHLAFKAVAKPIVDDMLVVDFTPQN